MPGILTGPGIASINAQNEEAQFSNAVAKDTGLDPRVVWSWASLETGGNAIGHNWLNIRPYPGDPYIGVSPGGFEEFRSVQDAITATERRIRQPFAGPILSSRGEPPAAEIAAIASTGWDAGHYGGPGGPSLLAEFKKLFPTADPGTFSGNPTTGVMSGQTTGGGGPFGVVGAVSGLGEGIWSWFTSHLLRLGLLLAGGALIIIGVLLVARSAGATPAAVAGV